MSKAKKSSVSTQPGITRDWQDLLEMLLEWETWLQQDSVPRKHVKLAQREHRHLMHNMEQVANRAVGVGMKVGKSGLKAANQTLSKTPFSCTTRRNFRQ